MSVLHKLDSARDYLVSIAEGEESGHSRFHKMGYTPTVPTTVSDVWSAGGVYVFPSGAIQMEVVSSLSTADVDIGTILYNATCDAGGTTTTLLDATYDWSAGTAAAGDIVVVAKSGNSSTAALTPEWGVITAVANGVITFSGGLSSGGTCNVARAYQILDVSAAKGAMAVKIDYLTTALAERTEIVILNTNTPVPLINADTYRINSFRVIAVGTKATALNAPGGNLSLMKNGALTYSYITAGFTRARNAAYTVPASKILYVNNFTAGYGFGPKGTSLDYARIFLRANIEPTTNFKTGLIFYPYAEITSSSTTNSLVFPIPLKFTAGVDVKVSCLASSTVTTGIVAAVYRGWLETA